MEYLKNETFLHCAAIIKIVLGLAIYPIEAIKIDLGDVMISPQKFGQVL